MNRKSFPRNWARPLLLGSILAVGAAAAWFMALGMITSVIEQWMPTQISEQIAITRDGEILIAQWGRGGPSYRTLSGQPVLDQQRAREAPSTYSSPHNRRNATSDNYGWAARIIGYRDTRLPPTYWYLIADDQPGGLGYFAGFDSRSKQPVGYLGLAGFRADIPPLSEQFDGAAITAGANGQMGEEPSAFSSNDPLLFLVSQGALYRFDLSQRSVSKVDLPTAAVSVADLPEVAKADTDLKERQHLAVRTADQILVVSFDGKLLRTVPVPAAAQDAALEVVHWSDGSSILAVRNTGGTGQIYWIDAQGHTTREETVQLVGADIWQYFRRWIWQTAVASPFPVLLAFFLLVVFPNSLVMMGRAPDFGTAIGLVMAESWPALLVVCLLAIALVPVVLKRQKLFAARGTVGWVLLVLLMGPAGFLGYWLHRHWPVLRRCESCGRTVPIDSLECAVCDVELPPPVAKGIEVVA